VPHQQKSDILDECGCCLCTPEEYGELPGTHPGGLQLVGDYPSLRVPPHMAPSHLLLDTCVVQNLLWARTRAPALLEDAAWGPVVERFGSGLGIELRALTGLLAGVEAELDVEDVLCPFVVTRASWHELLRSPKHRRDALVAEWRCWRARAQHFDPDTLEAAPDPRFTLMPETLRWPGAGQTRLPGIDDGFTHAAAFGPFRDEGDRLLIREALSLGVSAILTTDLKTFWRHRGWLYARGVEVWRPSDLCWALLNDWSYWRGEAIHPGWPTTAIVAEHRAAAA